jgi:glyoxylate/hydroxypyruvate reductase A
MIPMTLLLAASGWKAEPWLDRFRRLAPALKVVTLADTYDPAEIRYAATWKPPVGLLATLPNLKAIINLGAGVDALLTDATLPDVPLARVVDPDLTSRMRDYVVLHVLYHHRRMDLVAAAQREHRWLSIDQPAPGEVRVGILGYGHLGAAAAAALAGLGFDVAGWSRSPRSEAGPIPVFSGAEGLSTFLARSDILVALLPLTPETRGILNRDLFRQLPRDGVLGGAVLINAGRGGLQVEADILAALDEGALLAASLDVFDKEPLGPESPLWSHPRIVITPHNAADSDPEALAGFVVEQVRRVDAGLPLENLVDRRLGY